MINKCCDYISETGNWDDGKLPPRYLVKSRFLFLLFFFTKDRLFREIFINLKKDSLNFNGDDDVFEGKTCLRGGIKTKKKKSQISREKETTKSLEVISLPEHNIYG